MRLVLKQIVPPLIVRVVRNLDRKKSRGRLSFTGNYRSWQEAVKNSVGYDADAILQKTRAAILEVKAGKAAFERDSVIFAKPQYPFPLLAGLLRIALANGGRLAVVDFGGSLGSSYFQCRGFLEDLKDLRWNVVEQEGVTRCGRAEFQSDELRFYTTLDECAEAGMSDVLVLSAVVQYLERPYDFLEDIVSRKFKYIIADRTPFLFSVRDRLTVQTVPPSIYDASYPAWFFAENHFQSVFANTYEILAETEGADTVSPDDEAAYFKTFVFRRKRGSS